MSDPERCHASWRPVPCALPAENIEAISPCRCTLAATHDGYHVCSCGGQVWPVGTKDPEGDWYLRPVAVSP